MTDLSRVGTGRNRYMKIFVLLSAVFAFFLATSAANAAAPSPRIKPAAPGPVYLSPTDYETLDNFFNALGKNKTSLAKKYKGELTDSVAISIAHWAYFRSNPKDLDFVEAGQFLNKHSTWPSSERIQKNAEKKITDTADPEAVMTFFNRREPLTGTGKLRMAQAMFAKDKIDAGIFYLRKAWIEHDWSSVQEKEIIRYYGKHLTEEDHWAKADRQLFEIKATNTRRLLSQLSSSYRRMTEARIALLRRDGNAVTLFNRLSADEKKDSGVLHAVTRYYRRGGKETTALKYAKQTPLNEQELRNPARWWTEKKLLARWALKNGYHEDAYAMTAYTGLIDGSAFAQAEFEAGWIALRFLNDPDRARPHFAYLNAGVTAPISRARAQYWLGRTFEAAGDRQRAFLHYMVAAEYPLTYYGQLAYEKISDRTLPPGFPEKTTASTEDEVVFNARPLVYAMRVLAEIRRDREFITFARKLDDQLQTSGEYAAYEEFMVDEGMIFLSVRAGKVAVKRNADAPSVSYPLIFIPDEAKEFTEQALILGLSRQESEFNPRAFSSARARGMMQMLPSTAKITARKEGIPYYQSRLLDDASYNLILGSAHLSHLIDRFDGSYIMTLAGYNAGPHRVDRWIREYGDPRDPNVDPVDWVELIPFSETRNYVQRVMENTQIYRAQINNEPIPGRLSFDLVRGGGTVTAIGIQPPTPVLARMRSQNTLALNKLPQPVPAAYKATENFSYDDLLKGKAEEQTATLSTAIIQEQLSQETASPVAATPALPVENLEELLQNLSTTETDDDTLTPLPVSDVSPPKLQQPVEDTEIERIAGCDLGEDTAFLEADDLNARQLDDACREEESQP